MRRLGIAAGWVVGTLEKSWRGVLAVAAFGCLLYGLDLISPALALCAAGAGGLFIAARPTARRSA